MIRKLFVKTFKKEFFSYIFFIAISALFWLLIVLKEVSKAQIQFNVKLINIPENVILTTMPDSVILASVKDNGYNLLSYRFKAGRDTIYVDFNEVANKKTGYGLCTSNLLMEDLKIKLQDVKSIAAIHPEKIEFYFNRGEKKKVPVRIKGQIRAANSYKITDLKAIPESVTVFAPQSILHETKQVDTKKINIQNIKNTTILNAEVADVKGARIAPRELKIRIKADFLTDGNVIVPIQAVNMPANKILRTFPRNVRVYYTIESQKYKLIRPEDFKVVADYRETNDGKNPQCILKIISHPTTVSRTNLEIKEVEYIIEDKHSDD